MLYHLSESNHEGEVFIPRVPLSTAYALNGEIVEDVDSKRVCFSTTISGTYKVIKCFKVLKDKIYEIKRVI